MLVHSKTGPLPEFQPNDDIQRGLSWLTRTEIHPGITWLLSFVNGAVIWGLVFGQTYRFLPGEGPWQKGVFFGLCAWMVMGLVFFPLVDRGIFAVKLGLGRVLINRPPMSAFGQPDTEPTSPNDRV
jgi:Family of unknown function (DUF6789)